MEPAREAPQQCYRDFEQLGSRLSRKAQNSNGRQACESDYRLVVGPLAVSYLSRDLNVVRGHGIRATHLVGSRTLCRTAVRGLLGNTT